MPDPSTPPSVARASAADTSLTNRAADTFARLVAIMARLRGPDGCPWDREQTLASLAPYVIEEAAEVVDAIERGDLDNLREEIGDLLFEGVFLAEVTRTEGVFDVADALTTVSDKLVRRHPHVFQRDVSLTPAEVKAQWDVIKAEEKAARGTAPDDILAGIPVSLPALMRARDLCRKAAGVGFDWPDVESILDKVDEELAELREAIASAKREHAAEELGDLLFVIANLARRLDVDPEAALRGANRKFERRFRTMQGVVEATGTPLADATLEQMEDAWQEVKRGEG